MLVIIRVCVCVLSVCGTHVRKYITLHKEEKSHSSNPYVLFPVMNSSQLKKKVLNLNRGAARNFTI